jgi:RNA polymerase sigma-70 factor (ECF subfamily)
MTTSDEQLILEVRGGSAEAFTELFQRYRQPIYAFFRRRLEHPARAEELAQETFVAVLRGAARYEPRALFRTYLYGIALNVLMAERRKTDRETNHSAVAEQKEYPAQLNTPEQAVWVRGAVDKLQPDEREILLLREYEGLSYDEIAALLHLPLNTVRSRLFRARMALKNILIPLQDQD